MTSTRITVPLGVRSYPIVIGFRHLAQLPSWLRRVGLSGDPVIVTNPLVWRTCGAGVRAALRGPGGRPPAVLTIPDTERSKSMAELTRLLNRVASLDGVGRRPYLVAFGGGVVGDVTGLVAALYRRGIPYVQIPTTVLAQVDSAIGGKTAVDLPAGKNLVGAFWQPRLVFTELAYAATLPTRQLVSGLAEVIKCGVIRDPALVRYLERHAGEVLARRPAALRTAVAAAARLKATVVGQDERETLGVRTILNFGHTIGHAIEAATEYRGRYTHGEAVAIGMHAAAAMACRLGVCDDPVRARLERLLIRYGLPTRARGVSRARVAAALGHDKKVRRGRLRWVLPTRVGHVIVTADVPAPIVQAILKECIVS